MNKHLRRAALLLASVVTADVIAGFIVAVAEHVPAWHGIYCTVGLTTTDGCDIPFHSGATYAVATIAMILFVPLWGAVFSFFTSGLTASHVDAKTDRQTQDLKEHVSDTARSA